MGTTIMTSDRTGYHSSMTTLGGRELKRLERPDKPARYRRTDRDFLALEALARFNRLTSKHIAQVCGGSPVVVGRRLNNLFRDGLVFRPTSQLAQLAANFHHGAAPLVYALTRKGARLLQERGFDLSGRLDWTFRPGTAPALAHTLAVADVMLALDLAIARLEGHALVDHHDLIPLFPEATRKRRRPFALTVSVSDRGRDVPITNVPDRLLSLMLPDRTRLNLALELDRGNESVHANRLVGKASIRKKLVGYYHGYLQNRFRETWGFERLRILFVTTSQTRLENMLAEQRVVTGGRAAGLFLYSTPERLAQHGPLGPAWASATGDGHSLLPTTPLQTATKEDV
jgi:hypothetical protein